VLQQSPIRGAAKLRIHNLERKSRELLHGLEHGVVKEHGRLAVVVVVITRGVPLDPALDQAPLLVPPAQGLDVPELVPGLEVDGPRLRVRPRRPVHGRGQDRLGHGGLVHVAQGAEESAPKRVVSDRDTRRARQRRRLAQQVGQELQALDARAAKRHGAPDGVAVQDSKAADGQAGRVVLALLAEVDGGLAQGLRQGLDGVEAGGAEGLAELPAAAQGGRVEGSVRTDRRGARRVNVIDLRLHARDGGGWCGHRQGEIWVEADGVEV
jgi:hypothetical protein